ncbi:PAS domain S-box protein [Ekhidna sp.]
MKTLERILEEYPEDKEFIPMGYARKEIILDDYGDPVDWKYLDVNEAFELHTGISIKGLVGKCISEIMPDPKMYQDWLAVYYDVAFSQGHEQFVNWAEPLQKWLEINVYSSKKGHCTVFLRDVTNEQEEKKIYADILANITDTVFITDDNGNFRYVCSKVSNIFGFIEEEVWKMQNIKNLLGSGFFDISEVHEQGEIANIHRVIEGKFGEKYDILINIKRVDVANGTLLFTCRDITDRLKAERANEKSNAHLKAFMNAIPDLVWIKDPNGKYLACNNEFEKLFNASEAEIIGRTDYDFVPKELADFFRANDKAAIKKRGPSLNEETLTYADGSKHDVIVETTKTPVYDSYDNLIGVLGIARDITQRKAEVSLLKGVFNQSPYGIALVSDNGKPYEVNKSLCEFLGYDEEELKSLTFKKFTHPEDFPIDFDLYNQLVSNKIESYEIEKRYIRKDGEIVYANLIVTQIEDQFAEGGKRALAMVDDITVKVKAQHELNLLNERYKQMIESAPDAVYVFSQKGTITEVNNAAISMSGYKRAELIGQPIWTIDKKWDEIAVEKYFAEVKEGEAQLRETIHTSKEGKEISVEVNLNPVKLDYNTWVIGMVRDVTKRKEIEQKLSSSEAKYKGVVETASDAIFIVSMEGDIIEVNDMACNLLGYSHKEFQKMNISHLDLDWSKDRIEEFGKILQKEKRALFETTHKAKDGRIIPIEMSLQYFQIDREPVVVSVGRDITERKQYERSQKNMLNDLIRAQEIANMGSWHLDVNNDFLVWSDQVYRIFGEKPQSFSRSVEDFYEYVHPDEREQVKELFNKCVQEKTPYEVIHRIVTKDGIIKYVEEKAEIVYNEYDELIEAHGTVQDVTKEVKSKHDLNLQIQKLNLAMENNGILAWETDFETHETTVFPKGEDHSNIPKVNVESPTKVLAQIRNEHRVFCEKKLDKLQNGEIDKFTCEFQVSDDSVEDWIWHRGDLTTIEKTSDGLPKRIFGTIQNIDEKKDAERLQILSQEQERIRIARDIHDSIGQMLVATRLMLNQTLGKEVSREKIKKLNESINIMLGDMIKESRLIINNFSISLSKNENLKNTFIELAEKTKKVYSGEIIFKWTGDDDINDLSLGVNIFRIYQEALTNAIKYSGSEMIEIKVINQPFFQMYLIDNGKGFDESIIDSGFGIQNMKDRAKNIGGTVKIESQKGKGTTVLFTRGED